MKVVLTRPARSWKKRRRPYQTTLLLALVIFASPTFYHQTLRAADKDPIIAGQLLVATNEIADPRFAETVVYIVKHDAAGTLGLIINVRVTRRTDV